MPIKQLSSLPEILQSHAQSHPDNIAFIFLADGIQEKEKLTYAELDSQARAIAKQLQKEAMPGDRILLCYPPGLDFIPAFMGCLYAGMIAVPAFPLRNNRHAERLHVMLEDCQARLILSAEKLIDYMREHTGFENYHYIATDKIEKHADYKIPKIPLNQIAFLQYTSGSTGHPKGVMVNHTNIIHNMKCLERAFGFDQTDNKVTAFWIPVQHDMSLLGEILITIYIGGKGIMLSPTAFIERPLNWLKAIQRYKAHYAAAPNFAYDLCVEKITDTDKTNLDLSSWRAAMNASEPVRWNTLEKFHQAFKDCGLNMHHFLPAYGLAEVTLLVSGSPVGVDPINCTIDKEQYEKGQFIVASPNTKQTITLSSSGRILWADPAHEIKIVDPETLKECSATQMGEVWINSQSVAQGYWEKPEATTQTFKAYLADGRGPYMRTGDLGILHEGELYITGRIKDILIIQGRNLYPQDIEAAVEACHPAIRLDCTAAFSVDIHGIERLVVAAEIERTARKQDTKEIFNVIRTAIIETAEIAPYSIQLLQPAQALKTTSGKIQRQATKRAYLAGELKTIAVKEEQSQSFTSNNLENDLRRIYAEILEVKEFSATDKFSELGGDSFKAVLLCDTLSRYLGTDIELSPSIAFDYPTLAGLTQYIHSIIAGQRVSFDSNNKPAETIPEPIAIIGMSCRFPGDATDPESFWKVLLEGKETITEIPKDRWNLADFYDPNPESADKTNIRHGAFIKNVKDFDADFFGIAPIEVETMDPQQRILLEVTWHALENAGINPQKLQGTDTSVFVGAMAHEYGDLLLKNGQHNSYFTTGNTLSVLAGRVSYFLGLEGLSVAVDTACSSSLVALHEACETLNLGETNLAIVSGVNALLSPDAFINLSKAKMLAVDGHCKVFSEEANGYVRGEGCGVVILKRLSDAQRDGDNILSIIKSTVVNQDGASSGLTVPNGVSQEHLLYKSLQHAKLDPKEIDYIETHGTGTKIGDPMEMHALNNVYQNSHNNAAPLLVGSVKANIGHLEAAAGMASLIKVILSMQHEMIPPQISVNKVNEKINLTAIPAHIPLQPYAWQAQPHKIRRAGISSFGFSGTNAHVIVEEANSQNFIETDILPDQHLLLISAKTPKALQQQINLYIDYLKITTDKVQNICYTSQVGRYKFEHGVAVLGRTIDELITKLEQKNSASAEEILLHQYKKDVRLHKVNLPLYPFENHTYWAQGLKEAHGHSNLAKGLHPLLGHAIHLGAVKGTLFSAEISRDYPDFVMDHCVFDIPVVTGPAYISAIINALYYERSALQGGLEQINFFQPLALLDDNARELQIYLSNDDADERTIFVQSKNSDDIHSEDWIQHATVKVANKYDSNNQNLSSKIQELPASYKNNITKSQLYEEFMQQKGNTIRGHSSWVEEMWSNAREGLGRLRLPGTGEDKKDGFLLHQGSIESCVYMGAFLQSIRNQADSKTTYLPYAIEKVSYNLSLQEDPMWVYIEFINEEFNTSDLFQINGYLLGADGRVMLKLHGLWLKAAAQEAVLQSINNSASPIAGSINIPAHEKTPAVQFNAEQVMEIVRSRASIALGLASEELAVNLDKGLMEMGMDSLIAVELASQLRNYFGETIIPNATVLYNYPNIRVLCDYILSYYQTPETSIEVSANPTIVPDEPIAIIGMSGRFPGAADINAFWQLLAEGRSGVTEVPANRWDIEAFYDADANVPGKMCSRNGGFLDIPVGNFDAAFFGISPREATYVDPQQRILLETSWEALENAGINPATLRGTRTGVYIGIWASDYTQLLAKNSALTDINPYSGLGSGLAEAAGRISYLFGLQGPSVAIDTVCSSSLVALHQACEGLQLGECDTVLVGGVNLLLDPATSIGFSQSHMLSPDGYCKTFDESANGYVRGEGCGILVLKRLSAAQKDGDRVLAVIKATAVNQDGASSGFTAPNGLAQEKLLREALTKAQLTPNDISYLETHGTGTELGDPIEVGAIKNVYSKGRDSNNPLILGAVKSNIGHLESAAGVASVVKAILSLQHEMIPANLHFTQLNSKIDIAAIPAIIPVVPQKWEKQLDRKRYAAISAFGATGTNAHVIIAEAPNFEFSETPIEQSQHALIISAKTPEALAQQIQNYIEYLKSTTDNITNICYTSQAGRYLFEHKVAVIAANIDELILKLENHIYASEAEVTQYQYAQDVKLNKVVLPSYAFARCYFWAECIDKGIKQISETAINTCYIASDEKISKYIDRNHPPAEQEQITKLVREYVLQVLGLPIEDTKFDNVGFFELGMDSLMAVELSRHLGTCYSGIEFNSTLCFDYPSINKLSSYIAQNLSSNNEISEPVSTNNNYTQEPIAIVGMSCRFPGGANSPEEFWQLLENGFDAGVNIPINRWDMDKYYDPDTSKAHKIYTKRAALLNIPIEEFDAEFFGISPREAELMDPQQRLLLEVSWEAMQNAAIPSADLSACKTGVFLGIYSTDYRDVLSQYPEIIGKEAYVPTGNFSSTAGGRISYVFGLTGPNMSIDTACSSALVAVHNACQSLRLGESDVALAGGVNVILSPDAMVMECRMQMLSPDGACKTFDKDANGFMRGEGCGIVVLKRLSAAQEAGDRILAIIKGSAINQDGASSGLTVPNGLAQEAVISQALAQAGLEPNAISYVETHGTGTRLGDPIEVNAIGHVYGKNRDTINPLTISTVKTNIGHLEAAAGIAGLIKTVLSLQHERIPQHLHFTELNPEIDLNKIPAQIPLQALDWKKTEKPRRAGVSSFGFSGTNAHLILEESPNPILGSDPMPTYTFNRQRYWPEILNGAQEQRNELNEWCYQANWILQETQTLTSHEPNVKWFILSATNDICANNLQKYLTNAGIISSVVTTNELEQQLMHSQDATGIIDAYSYKKLLVNQPKLAMTAVNELLQFYQKVLNSSAVKRIMFFTSHAHTIKTSSTDYQPWQRMLWGLGRSISWEYADVHCQLIDIDSEPLDDSFFPFIVADMQSALYEEEIAYHDTQRYVRQFSKMSLPNVEDVKLNTQGTYVVTGGLGGLGLAVTRWLAEHGISNIMLISRHTPDAATQQLISALQNEFSCQITHCAVDVSDYAALAAVITPLLGASQYPLAGIFHLAGIDSRVPFAEYTREQLLSVLAPKVLGGWFLHELTKTAELTHFVCYSSISSLFGSTRQTAYVIANSFLDGLANFRRTLNLPITNINWGPWQGVGLAAKLTEHADLLNSTLSLNDGLHLLGQCMNSAIKQDVGIVSTSYLDFMLSFRKNIPDAFKSFVQKELDNESKQTSLFAENYRKAQPHERAILVKKLVKETLHQVLKIANNKEIPLEQGFFDLGMDSLMAVELHQYLAAELQDLIKIPPTIAFNHSSVKRLTEFLQEQLLTVEKLNLSEHAVEFTNEPIAIIGMSCRFPGGANSIDEYWQNLASGKDCISLPKANRWDGTPLIYRGGFIDDIDQFDADFFGISPREAQYIDPQQRILLETAWHALENAGIHPKDLRGSDTGVFVGITQSEYGMLAKQTNIQDTYFATGNALNVSSGRLAYVLGLQGPALAIDTACSSSLVAIHEACRSLQHGECKIALGAGVNALLSSEVFAALTKANMLAGDGYCKTFDEKADGYVRGEGCGVLVLKRLTDAEQDKDNILAVIKGSAVNQGGASGGLTVPNGIAQEQVIKQALINAQKRAKEVDYIEAHGTGTSLGDPIEMEAIAHVYCQDRDMNNPLFVSTVKPQIGHLESASGVAGLIKVVLALQKKLLPQHLHLEKINPHMDIHDLPIVIPTEKHPWQAQDHQRSAGISSFGFSGTNAHLILEEAPEIQGKVREALPLQVFNKQRYWLPVKSAVNNFTVNDEAHPLLQKKTEITSLNSIIYESSINCDYPEYVSHHKVYDKCIVPGLSHASTLMSVMEDLNIRDTHAIKEMELITPLIVEADAIYDLYITTKNSNGIYYFEILSKHCDSEHKALTSSTTLHAAGVLAPENPLARNDFSLNELKEKFLDKPRYEKSEHERLLTELNYQLDTHHLWLEYAYVNTNEALVNMRAPNVDEQSINYVIYPGLLEACTQSLLAIVAKNTRSGNAIETQVPSSIANIRVYADHAIPAWVYAQTDPDAGTNFILFNEKGDMVAEIHGFKTRSAARERLIYPINPTMASSCYYEQKWLLSEEPILSEKTDSGDWLVISDEEQDLHPLLTQELSQLGNKCWIISENMEALDIQITHFKNKNRKLLGVIYLAPLTEENYLQPCATLLTLMRKLSKEGLAPNIWINTQNAYVVENSPVMLAHAALNGFIRSLVLEYPEFTINQIDSSLEDSRKETLEQLMRLVNSKKTEQQIALRARKYYVARLTKSNHEIKERKTIQFDPEGAYLVTGGLGGLGLQLAQWLVDQGAKKVILTARHEPRTDALAVMEGLTKQGAEISFIASDMSDKANVESLFRQLSTQNLKGIFHTAGIINDAPANRQTLEQLQEVFAAKALGAWYLHEVAQTYEIELDYFVLFSSIAALNGSPAQSNYAAANSFLDSLAHYRHQRGLNAISINWGPWSEVGMAKNLGAKFQKQGVTPLKPTQGLEALSILLAYKVVQEAILIANWTQLTQSLAMIPSWLYDLSNTNEKRPFLLEKLHQVSANEKPALIRAAVANAVNKVLALEGHTLDDEQDLFGAGMDSLMALELKNQLLNAFEWKIQLTTDNIFYNPTINKLTNHIRQQFEVGTSVENYNPLRCFKKEGTKSPLFCVHGVDGHAEIFTDLVKGIHIDRPIYVFQGLEQDNSIVFNSIEERAQFYIQALQLVQPHGPYYLLGWSMGGAIALEMTRQLRSQGEQVAFLGVVDGMLGAVPKSNKKLSFKEAAKFYAYVYSKEVKPDLYAAIDNLEGYELLQLIKDITHSEDKSIENIQQEIIIIKNNFDQLATYAIQDIDQPIILFNPKERAANAYPNELNRLFKNGSSMRWMKLSHSIRKHLVDGDHFTMLDTEHNLQLERCLEKYLSDR